MKWSFFLALCLFSFATMAQPAAPVYDFTTLDRKIDSILEARNVPGGQLALVNRDTTLWLGAYGYADLANKTPVTAETMFRIGSVTKSFVAASVMMLVETGELRLEDEVGELAPELPFRNRWSDTDPVRLVHLLEHTAGFDDMHMTEYATNGEGWTTLEGLQYHPHSKQSRWRPGKHMSYCNSGPPMAAYIVEKKTGKTIEDFIKERIFAPLGMAHSSLLDTETVRERLSKGYMGKDQKEAPYWHILNRSAGSINSTAAEMAQYLRFYLNRGMVDSVRLLSPASVARMETPTSTLAAKAGVREGYGLHIHSERYRGVSVYGHNGGMNGFLANMKYIPDLGVGYVYFINKGDGGAMDAINQAVLDFFIPEPVEMAPPEKTAADDALAGYYRSATSRNQIFRFVEWPAAVVQIIAKDGQLYHRPFLGEERPMQTRDKHLYDLTLKSNFSTPVVFVRDEAGDLIMQAPHQSANYYRTSGLAVWGAIIILGLCNLLLLSAVVAALIWIPIWLFGDRKMRNVQARVWPLLAALSAFGFSICTTIGGAADPIRQFGTLTPVSFLIFLFSSLLAVFTIGALWTGIRSFERPMNRAARIHSFLIGLACLGVTSYLWYWGVLGVRLWTY